MARFFSKEWVEQFQEACNSNADYLEKAKGLTAKVLFVVTDCPDDTDVRVFLEFENGKMTKAEHAAAPSPSPFRPEKKESDMLYKSMANYDTWSKLNRKEIHPMQAMAMKLYAIEGSMVKMMPQQANFNHLNVVMIGIPCEY
jgi:hypothetical protein